MLLPNIPVLSGKLFPIFLALFLVSSAVHAQAPKLEAQAAATPAAVSQAPAPVTPAPAMKPDAAPAPSNAAPAAAPSASDTVPTVPGEPSSEAKTDTGSSLIPHDLSPYGMFMNADIIVKVVMVGLAFASLVTWTILLVKTVELLAARRNAGGALADIAGAASLRDASGRFADSKAPVARLVRAALHEEERSTGLPAEGVKERATALLSRIETRAGRSMARGTGLLATIGSTAPFVGLFGTVWGIMNAFIGISKTNTTNLAVVAPGIAEALLATAFGLVAAIPAVVIYNMFARGITSYRGVLGDASTEVLRLLSRDLDRAQASAAGRPAGRAAAE